MVSPSTTEYKQLFSFDTFRKLLINFTILKAEHEHVKAEHEKAQESLNFQATQIIVNYQTQEIETEDRF